MTYFTNDFMFVGTSGVTIVNSSAETSAIPAGVGTTTIPANVAVAGTLFRLKGGGIFSTLITPGNLTVKIKLGSVAVASVVISNLLASASNNAFDFEGIVIVRSTGASGTVVSSGWITYEIGVLTRGVAALNNAGATSTIDFTAGQAIDVTVQWQTANSANSITTTMATIEPFNI